MRLSCGRVAVFLKKNTNFATIRILRRNSGYDAAFKAII